MVQNESLVMAPAQERIFDVRSRRPSAHSKPEQAVDHEKNGRGRATSRRMVDHARRSALDHGTLVWCRTKVL